MIILEGPDGSGKTTLLELLTEKFQLPKHERFCTSDGPYGDLASLAFRDVRTMTNQTLSIYDRHPFLSEYAYASAIPERVVGEAFLEGWAIDCLKQLSRNSLVIMCLPPFAQVLQNVTGCQLCQHPDHTGKTCTKVAESDHDPDCISFCNCVEMSPPHHMSGVAENIGPIYQMYQLLHVFWPEKNNIILYNYTDGNSLRRVLSRCQLHISNWNR